jgi:hypothetical protein
MTKTPIQKLDDVLSFMAAGGFEKGGLVFDQLLRLVNEKKASNLDGDELVKILDQLKDDKYIKSTVKREWRTFGAAMMAAETEIEYFSVTYKGIIFNNLNGYSGKETEKHRFDLLEIQHRKTESNLYRATVILAIGTSIAAIYYLIEIFKNACH